MGNATAASIPQSITGISLVIHWRHRLRILRLGRGVILLALLFCWGSQPAFSQGQTDARSDSARVVDIQLQRAQMAMRGGASLREARTRLNRVLALVPDHAEALHLRARAHLALRAPQQAIADAERALQLMGPNVATYATLVEAARQVGDRPRAVEALEAAIAVVDDTSPHHLRLSWSALQLEHYDHAEALARVALHRQPYRAAPYQQLARVFVRTDRTADAAFILHQGLERGALHSSGVVHDDDLKTLATHPLVAPLLER